MDKVKENKEKMRNKKKVSVKRGESKKRSGDKMNGGREGRSDKQFYCVRMAEYI